MALPPPPPPKGDFDNTGWSLLIEWLFKIWKWVTIALLNAVTNPFGNATGDVNTYSLAVAFLSGMSDDGGQGGIFVTMPPGDASTAPATTAFVANVSNARQLSWYLIGD